MDAESSYIYADAPRRAMTACNETDVTSKRAPIVVLSGAGHAKRSKQSGPMNQTPTDATVLINGGTGTGKELVARAIHWRSRRSAHAFVSVNCAAILLDLIASELFAHEKGAFTGATPETQVPLLTVLEEWEFERVGGGRPIHVDVRVFATTNHDLSAAAANGTLRQGLLYRLNVFPIERAPLRERKDDILILVEYFVQRYASRAGKNILLIAHKTLDLLQSYDRPGNIRELQNVIERPIIDPRWPDQGLENQQTTVQIWRAVLSPGIRLTVTEFTESM